MLWTPYEDNCPDRFDSTMWRFSHEQVRERERFLRFVYQNDEYALPEGVLEDGVFPVDIFCLSTSASLGRQWTPLFRSTIPVPLVPGTSPDFIDPTEEVPVLTQFGQYPTTRRPLRHACAHCCSVLFLNLFAQGRSARRRLQA